MERSFNIGDWRKVDMWIVMRDIGERGHHIFIRYDPLRTKNNFTVVIDRERIGDTDHPSILLGNWWGEHYGKE